MAFRIDSPGALNGRFTEGNPASGTPATVVSADWLNMVQEEIMAVLAGAGFAQDRADNGQMFAAIRALILQQAGLLGDLRNTDVGNLLALISALQGRVGSLETQRAADVTNLNNSDQAIIGRFAALETGSRLLGVAAYPPGVYTHRFNGACRTVYGVLVGGGAGGGSGPTPASGFALVGSGGGAGGCTIGVVFQVPGALGASQTITVGAGGAGQVGSYGLGGGTTSFGSVGAALGGLPGSTFGSSVSGIGNSGAGAGAGSWVANDISSGIVIAGGAPGSTGIILAADRALSGAGGSGPWGGGGAQVGQGLAGVDGRGPGSGGSGSCQLAGQGPFKGGNGAGGIAIVLEFS